MAKKKLKKKIKKVKRQINKAWKVYIIVVHQRKIVIVQEPTEEQDLEACNLRLFSLEKSSEF